MELQYLSISKRASYEKGYKEGDYKGTVTYSNEAGKIELNLSPALSAAVLVVVADNLVAASREVATTLTAACITQPALAAPAASLD